MMKSEQLLKFKILFESQKRGMVPSYYETSQSFENKKEVLADEMDLTCFEQEQQLQFRLKARDLMLSKKIDAALLRIKEGSFGECVECGTDIEEKRLEIRPTATHCVGCKEEQERRELVFHRSA